MANKRRRRRRSGAAADSTTAETPQATSAAAPAADPSVSGDSLLDRYHTQAARLVELQEKKFSAALSLVREYQQMMRDEAEWYAKQQAAERQEAMEELKELLQFHEETTEGTDAARNALL